MDNLNSPVDPTIVFLLANIPDSLGEQERHTSWAREPEQLAASLQTLLRHVPAGVIISEAPSGRILFGNDRMEQLLGHPIAAPDGVAEYAVWRGFRPDGRPYAPNDWPFARRISTGEAVGGEETHIERLDGTRLALLVSAAPVRDWSGKIMGGIVVQQNITDHKRTTDALKNSIRRETEARLEAQTANAFKGQFISMASDIKKSGEAGFCGHLAKPLDFQLLQATIQQARQVAHASSGACKARFDES